MMGLLIKFVVVYESPHWRQAGYSGELVSAGQGEESPVCITFDDSDEKRNALVGFIGGKMAYYWAEKGEKEMKNAIIDHLVNCFGSWAYEHTDIVVKDWSREPFIDGSPVTVQHVGSMVSFKELRTPCDNIHFGGTETAIEWIGYMEGAIESGTRGALEVLRNIKPQSLSPKDLMVSSISSTLLAV